MLDKYGVHIQLRSEVSDVEAVENDPKVRFKLKVNAVEWQCQNLIIATGGLSMPGLGASPFGYQIAEQFGLNVIPPRASLVPFTWRESEKILRGTIRYFIRCGGDESAQNLYSSNAIHPSRFIWSCYFANINYWQPGESIHLDLLPYNDIRHHLDEMRQSSPKLQLKTVLSRLLPKEISRTLVRTRLNSRRSDRELK